MLTLKGFDLQLLEFVAESIDSSYAVYPSIRKGKTRWIEAPNPKLLGLQRRLLQHLLYSIAPTQYAHGFVRGKSIVTNAAKHVGKPWLVTLDIKDFFPSISREKVKQALCPYFRGDEEVELISRLVCRKEHLPQGAPTSPHLANLVFKPIDLLLADQAFDCDWTYTRYADDLAFSGSGDPQHILQIATNAVRAGGFRVAPHKTKIRSQHQRQVVTGIVVNKKVGLPKPIRRMLRAAVHNISMLGNELDPTQINKIYGQLSFAAFVDPELYSQQKADLFAILFDKNTHV